MNEPWRVWRKPAGLNKYRNGELPASALVRIPAGGTGVIAYLWTPAGTSATAMYRAAKADGITLKSTGKQYRPLKAQEALFLERMSPTPTTRVPRVTRKWRGRTWWLKPGKAPVATPGTSVHGWGAACDWDVRQRAVFEWLCANGPRFGWYLAGPRTIAGKPNPNWEPWHWQWCGNA